MPPGVRSGEVLALVLGRGGSKGLPGKNVKPLGGAPLVAWAVAAGRCAPSVDRVICSTDDPEISQAAGRFGAEIPFMRPAELARDGSTDLDVFRHALGWLADAGQAVPEFVVQLRPTTPFRDPAWIEAAVAKMKADPGITAMRSVAPAPHTPYKMWRREKDGRLQPLLALSGVPEPYNMPRQHLPSVYWHTGQVDVIRSETILAGSMTGESIHAVEVPAESAIDIDHALDFQLAELAFERQMAPSLRKWIGDHA
jgi:CMP-N,N'-diacetyllegionaminic acid synthase